MFKGTKIENLGINISGEKFRHLRFADHLILMTDDFQKADEMLNELYLASKQTKHQYRQENVHDKSRCQ